MVHEPLRLIGTGDVGLDGGIATKAKLLRERLQAVDAASAKYELGAVLRSWRARAGQC